MPTRRNPRSGRRRSSRPVPRTAPQRHHIDRFAGDLIAANSGGNGDDLLDTKEAAEFLRVSRQFLEIGRHRGYGPPYQKVGRRRVFYRRKHILKWLDERVHRCTSEYMEAR